VSNVPLVRLGDICWPKQHPTIPMSEFTVDGYPVFGANGQVGFYKSFTHAVETIAITCRGATCGTVNIAPARSYITGNAMALDDLDSSRADLHFLARALRFRGVSDVISGSAQPQITRGPLLEVKVPLPSLPEQRRIAAILDEADALRAKRRAALAQLDEMARAIFVEMFGDPVSNTKGLPLVRLDRLGKLDRGVSRHRPRNAPDLLGGPYPFVQTGDVANCDGYIRTYQSTYSETGLRQSKMWPAGTLCITIAANIARVGILTFDACFPDSVVGFVGPDPATTEYVRVWFTFVQDEIESSAPESAQKNINLAILRNYPVPLSPQELQRSFAERLKVLEEARSSSKLAIATLDSLFASLQHRAFRGEL